MLGRESDVRDEETDTRALQGIYDEVKPYIWGLLVFSLVLFTGAGTTVLSQGILLVGVGATVFLVPPVHRVSGAVALLTTLLCILGLSAWLPVSDGMLSDWRYGLLSIAGVDVLPVLGPNLGDHAVSWLLLVTGLLWLRIVLTWRLSTEGCHAVIWLLAIVCAGLGAIVMVANKLDWRLPFASDPATFSFFPNRNHSSILLSLGACLSGGMAIYQIIKMRILGVGFATICTALCVSGMLPLQSRGGILFFVLGVIGFVAGTALLQTRKGSATWLRLGVPAVIMFISVFVLLDARVRDRIVPMLRGDFSGLSDEFRLAVWSDSWQLIEKNPLGVGLGQFAVNIPQYLDRAKVGKAVLHPESSWFWVLAELGWLGFGLLVAACVMLIWKAVTGFKRASHPIRILGFAGIGVFLAHSFVDVGMHRPALWVLGVLLLGVVFRRESTLKLRSISPLRLVLLRGGWCVNAHRNLMGIGEFVQIDLSQ